MDAAAILAKSGFEMKAVLYGSNPQISFKKSLSQAAGAAAEKITAPPCSLSVIPFEKPFVGDVISISWEYIIMRNRPQTARRRSIRGLLTF